MRKILENIHVEPLYIFLLSFCNCGISKMPCLRLNFINMNQIVAPTLPWHSWQYEGSRQRKIYSGIWNLLKWHFRYGFRHDRASTSCEGIEVIEFFRSLQGFSMHKMSICCYSIGLMTKMGIERFEFGRLIGKAIKYWKNEHFQTVQQH